MSFISICSAIIPCFNEILERQISDPLETNFMPLYNIQKEWVDHFDHLSQSVNSIYSQKPHENTEQTYNRINKQIEIIKSQFAFFIEENVPNHGSNASLNFFINIRIIWLANKIHFNKTFEPIVLADYNYFHQQRIIQEIKVLETLQKIVSQVQATMIKIKNNFLDSSTFLKQSIKSISFYDSEAHEKILWMRLIHPDTFWMAKMILLGYRAEIDSEEERKGGQGRIDIVKMANKKIIRKTFNSRDSYWREVSTLYLLNGCPHIIGLLSHCSHIKQILEEYANKGDFHTWISNFKHTNNYYDIMYRGFFQMCMGIQEMQKYKILHGDLKLENVLVLSNNKKEYQIKICDFGHACDVDKDSASCGTINTAPPELLSAALNHYQEDVLANSAIDIFSTGIIMYSFLSGNRTLLTCSHDSENFERRFNFLQRYYDKNGSLQCNNRLLMHFPYDHEIIRQMLKINPQERPTMKEVFQKLFPEFIMQLKVHEKDWLQSFFPELEQ